MISDREYKVLEKYLKGGYVEDEDKDIIDEFSSIGLIRRGFDTSEGICRETASLTHLGKELFYRERIMKNPFKRVFYYLTNTIS